MSDYDAWKLDSPKENIGCSNCGEQTDIGDDYCNVCINEHGCVECYKFMDVNEGNEIEYFSSRNSYFVCADCLEKGLFEHKFRQVL